ncbi:MAG: hypothetical protein MUQ65_11105, partial [Armatimonadetes bacterium]|nr:hypothetical protein [Armatimonadota bacterium]
DICCAECSGVAPFAWSWGGAAAGIAACPTGAYCPECYNTSAVNVWYNSSGLDDEAKKSSTRHLGGTNVGWADGHASWTAAQSLCAMSDAREIQGVGLICGEYTSLEGYRNNCGDPPAGMQFMFGRATSWNGS